MLRSAPPDWPSTASGKNGSAVITSRQANRPHKIADAKSSAPNGAEIQSNLRPPQDSASSSATAADIIRHAPIRSSLCLRG